MFASGTKVVATLAKRSCWAMLLSLNKLFRHSFLLLLFSLELKMRNAAAATACTDILYKTVQLLWRKWVSRMLSSCVDSRKGILIACYQLACYQVASVCRSVNVPFPIVMFATEWQGRPHPEPRLLGKGFLE